MSNNLSKTYHMMLVSMVRNKRLKTHANRWHLHRGRKLKRAVSRQIQYLVNLDLGGLMNGDIQM